MPIVRQTTVDDVPDILGIKAEPMVARCQYPVDFVAYKKFLHEILSGDNLDSGVKSQISVIEHAGAVIGYVQHNHYSVDKVKMVYCSWNLTSAMWGQGIMRESLTQLFNTWLRDADTQFIFADHFRQNQRCERLMTRLGFTNHAMRIAERLNLAWLNRCTKLVVRRRLDATTWNANTQLANLLASSNLDP